MLPLPWPALANRAGRVRAGSPRLTVFVGQTYTDSCNWEAVVRGDPANTQDCQKHVRSNSRVINTLLKLC